MTRFDLHPEDLLERASRGTANTAELARLTQHLAECAVCRVERGLMVQAALDAAPLRDEELVVARLKRDVTARAAPPNGRRAKRKGAFVVIALAAGSVASVAAAATFVLMRGTATPQLLVKPPELVSPPAEPPRGSSPVKSDEPSVADEAKLEEPSESGEPEVARPAAPAAVEPASASELFSRANQARRDGKVTEAVRLYRALQERFSGSSEELVSRVTLGRLLLDRLGDSRGALVQFNSYLASPGGGVLREEAMVGRALSLGRMGRAAEERAAWQALLDNFPKSTQRKRAQARLAELGGAADGGVRAGTGAGRTERAQ
jgi:TolA-binding protein